MKITPEQMEHMLKTVSEHFQQTDAQKAEILETIRIHHGPRHRRAAEALCRAGQSILNVIQMNATFGSLPEPVMSMMMQRLADLLVQLTVDVLQLADGNREGKEDVAEMRAVSQLILPLQLKEVARTQATLEELAAILKEKP